MNVGEERALPLRLGEVEDELDLRDLWATLVDSRLLIAAVTAAALALSIAYAYLATPIYRSNALLQLDKRKGGLSGIEELSAAITGIVPAEAEIEIIRSRAVIAATVDTLQLDLQVSPKHFPIFGRAVAARRDGAGPASAWLGADSYAWGGERIRVNRFEVPPAFEGVKLTLVAGADGAYRVRDGDETLLEGKTGEPAAAESGVRAFVSQLEARPGTEFVLRKLSRIRTIEALQKQLEVAEKGEQTGVIELSYIGASQTRVAEVLDTIAETYLRQDVERRSAEAEQTLKFLSEQLPEIRTTVETAETRLSEYRSRVGAVDLSITGQELVSQLSKVEAELSALQLQQAELRQRFTASHPTMLALYEKFERLRAVRDRLDGQLRQLPSTEQDSARLLRDASASNELYMLLLNKAQEIRVAKAGTVGNVRIVDKAFVPAAPFKPQKLQVGAIGLLLGLVAGVGAALMRRALDHGIYDPNFIERRFGTPVYAVIPHAREQGSMSRLWDQTGREDQPVLAREHPHCTAVEGLRSLRTSLQFALLDAPNNVITVTGSVPSIGKSFIATNLATVLAEADQKVLLVDCDLRKGKLHKCFGLPQAGGLSELITGRITREQAIHQHSANLHVIRGGVYPPNPSEVLLSHRFQELIVQLRGDYAVVLLDAAPLLVVTDGVLASRVAGTVFLVLRAGKHTVGEIELAHKRLAQSGITPRGAIFNDLLSKRSINYSYSDYYNYHYGEGYRYQYQAGSPRRDEEGTA
jgi:tyrosine-protein kinase Etk/Wzc